MRRDTRWFWSLAAERWLTRSRHSLMRLSDSRPETPATRIRCTIHSPFQQEPVKPDQVNNQPPGYVAPTEYSIALTPGFDVLASLRQAGFLLAGVHEGR